MKRRFSELWESSGYSRSSSWNSETDSQKYEIWGTSKQHMKLQQPRNYDFRVSQFDPPRSQSGNDRETTTKVATTVKRRLLHLAIIERQIITLTTTAKPQQLRVNSREMTTFAASCNDREMQRPRSDKFETAQLLQILRKILCCFMAVVVSSAFWKSLRNSIFGMASHDLSNTKTRILGATPGAIPGIDGNAHERPSFSPAFSERVFKNWCGPPPPRARAPERCF